MENFSALRIHQDGERTTASIAPHTVGLQELPEIFERLLRRELRGRTVVRLAGDLP